VKNIYFELKFSLIIFFSRYDDAWNEHTMEDPEEVAAMVDE
jgi:uncharacterized phage-like protein YoqJ